jgi:hypothetical protein
MGRGSPAIFQKPQHESCGQHFNEDDHETCDLPSLVLPGLSDHARCRENSTVSITTIKAQMFPEFTKYAECNAKNLNLVQAKPPAKP